MNAFGRALLFTFLAVCLTEADSGAVANPNGASSGRTVPIGLLVPLDGPQSEISRSLQSTLETYFSELSVSGSVQFRLRLIPAEKRWGRQTEEIVRSIFEDGTQVIIGGTDARSAHLAAQIISRSKGEALLISLSSDPTLTQSGVPWIFRMTSSVSNAGQAGIDAMALKAAGAVVRAYESGAGTVEEIRAFLASLTGFQSAQSTEPD